MFPDATLLRLGACAIDDATAQITLAVRSTQACASCPECTTPASHIHSHTVVAPWARRTLRLAQHLMALSMALGGTAGVRLGHAWGLRVSRNSLLRLLRRQPEPDLPTPRVLGVDDWALRQVGG